MENRGLVFWGPMKYGAIIYDMFRGVFLGVFEVLRVLGGMVKMAKTIDLGCFGVLLRYRAVFRYISRWF